MANVTVDRVQDRLILAVPSKGRLMDQAAALFERSGLVLRKIGDPRGYRGVIAGRDDVEVAFLSAAEIAEAVADGTAHAGITGLDLVHENVPRWETRIELLRPLGFGFADVVVAIPTSWIDVVEVADLEAVALAYRRTHNRRPRVATKYVNIARRFLTAHGVTSFLIVQSLGATEGTPAAGTADIIVDITTTGSTLRANQLRVPADGVILNSQAHLIASRTERLGPAARAALAEVTARLATA
jgi:ATP phosphoribosyltransferase